ncbi:MAG: L,D-transpeptidase family protein [Chitinophagaceae bacterium]
MNKLLYLILCAIPLLSFSPSGHHAGDGRLDPAKIDRDKVFLLIIKSNYRLYLYEDTKLLKAYKVVFGNNDLGDKRREGDRETPDGTFYIIAKHDDKRWNKFMLLDYPNKESTEKFDYRKEHGLIPANAKIGGGIGIHGCRPGVQLGIDLRVNWTNGCIGMKNEDVDELFDIVKVGTPVVIRQ